MSRVLQPIEIETKLKKFQIKLISKLHIGVNLFCRKGKMYIQHIQYAIIVFKPKAGISIRLIALVNYLYSRIYSEIAKYIR